MTDDLVIRGGDVVGGSGAPAFRADVGVRDGRVVRVGRIHARERDELDARGLVVAPGFIDGHTHMDAQVAWDPLGTCCWHGVTTVVMGNCGFTLAPCRRDEKRLVVRNLELGLPASRWGLARLPGGDRRGPRGAGAGRPPEDRPRQRGEAVRVALREPVKKTASRSAGSTA